MDRLRASCTHASRRFEMYMHPCMMPSCTHASSSERQSCTRASSCNRPPAFIRSENDASMHDIRIYLPYLTDSLEVRWMSKMPTRREQYRQSFVRNMAAELSTDTVICPKCGTHWILPGTARARLGVCQPCLLRAQAEAARLAADEIAAQRENDAARARKSRAMRKERRNGHAD